MDRQATFFRVTLGPRIAEIIIICDRPIYMRARVSREGYPVSMVPGQGWSHPAAAASAAAAAAATAAAAAAAG